MSSSWQAEVVVSTDGFTGARWKKSSRSGSGDDNACVEVAVVRAAVGVRDSKNPDSAHLVFGGAAWQAFAGAIKA